MGAFGSGRLGRGNRGEETGGAIPGAAFGQETPLDGDDTARSTTRMGGPRSQTWSGDGELGGAGAYGEQPGDFPGDGGTTQRVRPNRAPMNDPSYGVSGGPVGMQGFGSGGEGGQGHVGTSYNDPSYDPHGSLGGFGSGSAPDFGPTAEGPVEDGNGHTIGPKRRRMVKPVGIWNKGRTYVGRHPIQRKVVACAALVGLGFAVGNAYGNSRPDESELPPVATAPVPTAAEIAGIAAATDAACQTKDDVYPANSEIRDGTLYVAQNTPKVVLVSANLNVQVNGGVEVDELYNCSKGKNTTNVIGNVGILGAQSFEGTYVIEGRAAVAYMNNAYPVSHTYGGNRATVKGTVGTFILNGTHANHGADVKVIGDGVIANALQSKESRWPLLWDYDAKDRGRIGERQEYRATQ